MISKLKKPMQRQYAFDLLQLMKNQISRTTNSPQINMFLHHPFFINASQIEYSHTDFEYNDIKQRYDTFKRHEDRVSMKKRVDNNNKITSIQEQIVDWLFEVVTVLEKNPRSVFMAMKYLEIFTNSKVRTFREDIVCIVFTVF